MDAITKRITVNLTEEQMEFIKKLAEHDGCTISEAMQNLFYLQLREEMDYFEESGY